MKQNALLIAALIILSASVNAVAKEDPRNARVAVVPVKGSEVFKVIYKGDVSGRIKLSIYNATSQLIFAETINGDGFIRPLNFKGLTPGEYTIELYDGVNRKIEKVLYNPAANTASKRIVHISKIQGAESKYILSISNSAGEKVTVNIYNKANTIVHTETREITGEFAQVYNVKSADVSAIEVVDEAGNKKVSRF